MTEDHERIDELLAGYALQSLSGPDAEEADRLLSGHVPRCVRCRETLEAFREVAGELALAPRPVEPPDLVLARIRRGVGHPRRRRPLSVWATAGAVAAILALSSWNALLTQRMERTEERNALFADAFSALSQPAASKVVLEGERRPPARMLLAFVPGEERMYLVGTHVPEPGEGRVYRVWLGGDEGFTWAGDFEPDRGVVALIIMVDPAHYRQLLITEEEGDTAPTAPGVRRWAASF